MAQSDRAQEANELEEIRVLFEGAPIAGAQGISSPVLAKLYSGGTGCCNSARPDLWGRERVTSPSTRKVKNQASFGPWVGWGPTNQWRERVQLAGVYEQMVMVLGGWPSLASTPFRERLSV